MDVFRMKTANGDGLELRQYEDVIFANVEPLDPAWGVRYAKDFKYKQGDILLCTYPKCGTHWVLNIISRLKSLDSSKRPRDSLLEYGLEDICDTMESPRIVMTHLTPNHLPEEHIRKRGKLVLMLRNPKDAIVSRYFYYSKTVHQQNKQTLAEFFDSYIHGLIPFGSYFDYVRKWEMFIKEKQTDLHVEIFYYEDLKSNLNYNITRLNEFLGFNRDQKYITQVIKETTLTALRMQDASGRRETIKFVRDENGDSVVYRKGQVGDWKHYLTVAQSEVVDKLMVESLKYGIINVKYEI